MPPEQHLHRSMRRGTVGAWRQQGRGRCAVQTRQHVCMLRVLAPGKSIGTHAHAGHAAVVGLDYLDFLNITHSCTQAAHRGNADGRNTHYTNILNKISFKVGGRRSPCALSPALTPACMVADVADRRTKTAQDYKQVPHLCANIV